MASAHESSRNYFVSIQMIFIALMINYLTCLIATELVFNFTISDLLNAVLLSAAITHIASCHFDDVMPNCHHTNVLVFGVCVCVADEL